MERPTGAEAALRLLGIAARAGAVAWGTERVREAVRDGRALLVVVATDVSANTRDKLMPLLEQRRVPHVRACDRAELGAAVGRGPAAAVAVLDRMLAARIAEILRGGAGKKQDESRGG